MVFEGVPGGPMDCWNDVKTPEEHLARSKWILETFIPLEWERCRDIELTDNSGILAGRFPPVVRKPICKLPSGELVLCMGEWLPPMIQSRVKVRIRRAGRPASTSNGFWSTAEMACRASYGFREIGQESINARRHGASSLINRGRYGYV